jgi:DNA topoisomerase-2
MFFRQTFQNNMSTKTAPEVKPCKAGTTDYTRITFTPDFARFKMAGLDADIVALMSRRVYDIAGCSGSSLVVKLNGNKLPVRNFKQYADLYLPSEDSLKIHEVVNDRWEIIVSVSDGRFQQVSFVNGIATTKGGTHVNLVTDQLTKHIAAFVVKKHKNAKLKPFHVRNHVFIFVRSLIVNPAFDSQTKENLISRPNTFGSACELSEKMLKAVEKSAIVSQLVDFATHQNSKELAKNDGKKTVRLNGIPKLEDANCAGGKDADKCTLILTEGIVFTHSHMYIQYLFLIHIF